MNTEWPELNEALLVGTLAFEDPTTVRRIFNHRLNALLRVLRSGLFFGREIVWMKYVIECQQRGFPHAHIVCRLGDMVDLTE
jgi:hypothetical protein